jgi:5-methylcytosine-specific restriction enzyme A
MRMKVPVTRRIRGKALQQARATQLYAKPLCEHCSAKGLVVLATEVDHIVPLFKGGSDLVDNKQSLCSACHKIKTAQDKGFRARYGCDASGLPLDPNHHWNKA